MSEPSVKRKGSLLGGVGSLQSLDHVRSFTEAKKATESTETQESARNSPRSQLLGSLMLRKKRVPLGNLASLHSLEAVRSFKEAHEAALRLPKPKAVAKMDTPDETALSSLQSMTETFHAVQPEEPPAEDEFDSQAEPRQAQEVSAQDPPAESEAAQRALPALAADKAGGSKAEPRQAQEVSAQDPPAENEAEPRQVQEVSAQDPPVESEAEPQHAQELSAQDLPAQSEAAQRAQPAQSADTAGGSKAEPRQTQELSAQDPPVESEAQAATQALSGNSFEALQARYRSNLQAAMQEKDEEHRRELEELKTVQDERLAQEVVSLQNALKEKEEQLSEAKDEKHRISLQDLERRFQADLKAQQEEHLQQLSKAEAAFKEKDKQCAAALKSLQVKEDHQQRLEDAKRQSQESMEALKEEHSLQLMQVEDASKETKQQHAEAIQELKRQWQLELQALEEEHSMQIMSVENALRDVQNQPTQRQAETMQAKKEEHQKQLEAKNEEHQKQLQDLMKHSQADLECLKEEHALQLLAMEDASKEQEMQHAKGLQDLTRLLQDAEAVQDHHAQHIMKLQEQAAAREAEVSTVEQDRRRRSDALELALQVLEDQRTKHSLAQQDRDAELFSKFEEQLMQYRQALEIALQVIQDKEEQCATALEEQRSQQRSALDLAVQVIQDKEEQCARALEEQRAEDEGLFGLVLKEQEAKHKSALDLALQVIQDKDQHLQTALEDERAQHSAQLEEALQEQQAQHRSALNLALQVVQDREEHYAKELEDQKNLHAEISKTLEAQQLQHQIEKNAQQQNHVRQMEVKLQQLEAEAEEKEEQHQQELQALRAAFRSELDLAPQVNEDEAATQATKALWEERYDNKCKALLKSVQDAVQVVAEVELEGSVPFAEDRNEDLIYELSMAIFPVVCLDVREASLSKLAVTLGAFDVEAVSQACRLGVDLPSFGHFDKVPWTSSSGDGPPGGKAPAPPLLEPLGGHRGGFSEVEPESWLQTVRLRGQLEEEQRQMRMLDAQLQAIEKDRGKLPGVPRLVDLEDDVVLEPEPDLDDMLLLPLHINEVLRVLRTAAGGRSTSGPSEMEVICVPLQCAEVSIAVVEALEETKSTSSALALAEAQQLLWRLKGKEVPEPTLAPQEAGPNVSPGRRPADPTSCGAGIPLRAIGEPWSGERFPKPRAWQDC